MEKLKTNELSLGLNQTLRNDLVDNFDKIQKGVDGQADGLNKQILDILGKVSPQDQNEVTQARIDANGKPYDTLKGREDATQVTAETALSEERDTSVEVQNARTNSSSETYPSLKDRMDNQENDLNNSINDKLSQISVVPETFANFTTLQSKYPTGKTGLFVTADTGHKYIWTNNTWTDAGVYQGVGIADRSVKYEAVDYINFESIKDNYINDSKTKSWFTKNQAIVADHLINFRGEQNKDTGFMVHVTMRAPLKDNETLYLNFDYVTDRTGDATKNQSSVYLMDDSGNFLNGKTINLASLNETSDSKHVQVKLKNNMYGISIPTSFNILFASQSDYNLTINRLTLNKSNYTYEFKEQLGILNTDNFKNHPVDLTKYTKWNIVKDKVTILSNGSLLFTRTASDGDSGITFDVESDVSSDIYVTTNIVCENYSVWLMDTTNKLIGSLTQHNILKKFGDVTVHKITSEQLKFYALTNNTLRILVSVHGKNNLVINEISVSNQAGVGYNKNSMNQLIENDGYRAQNYIGQQTQKISTLSNASYAGLMYGGYKRTSRIDGLIKEISAYVPSSGSYKFAVANLDQYGLIVNKTDFTLNLVAGLNRLDVETNNIQIKENQLLLMDLSEAGVFTPDENGIFEPTILQDINHSVNQDGHGGNQLFDADKIVPFSYSVIDKTNLSKISEISKDVGILNDGLAEIIPLKNRLLISAPNGTKYKLVVDNSGVLSTISSVPNKVLIIGNSLTLEKGNIGMAASDGNHDYYQLVKNYILSANPNATVAERTSFSVWEMAENTANRDTLFNERIKPLLATDTDMVIVQLGDNVNTDARHATFANDVNKLVKNIRSVSPKATIIWVGSWFISYPTLMQEIKTAVENNGGLLADITKNSKDTAYQSYTGATRMGLDGVSFQVTSQGEASHPGDLGHKYIAEEIISNFDF
ncbi:ORF910 [Leuconostoc citreum LBAE E16]|uniref:SGNH/GDSL hydrolase family protein n=1 Tax=Leuconostoc citreum TaxID=33964 RepID=UPI0002466002|nr:hypothetical protein [Leuconostoc citreum]CCF28022.1 ORF910 [Leuconostoc citreum LBAE E16]